MLIIPIAVFILGIINCIIAKNRFPNLFEDKTKQLVISTICYSLLSFIPVVGVIILAIQVISIIVAAINLSARSSYVHD
jgi:hypothetical protein